MSYVSEFASNNVDLQGLIDIVKTLPEAENLDAELSDQDAKIAELSAILDAKAAAPVTATDDGNGNVTIVTSSKDAVVVLINFNVMNFSYQAEAGMTWSQFINSKYNTDGFGSNGSGVFCDGEYVSVDYSSSNLVSPDDVIIDGHSYRYVTYGGGEE